MTIAIKPGDVIAVDFDGTLCENAWPEIGRANDVLIDYLIKCKQAGAKLILWTMREGGKLHYAVEWCMERGLTFDAINDNLESLKDEFQNNPRKIYADYYIDDHNAALININGHDLHLGIVGEMIGYTGRDTDV